MKELQRLIKFNNECKQVTHISPVLITNLAAGKFSDDPILAKQLLCVSKKAGYQDENGNILVDNNKQLLIDVLGDQQKAEEVITLCIKQHETPEKTAIEVSKCISKNMPLV